MGAGGGFASGLLVGAGVLLPVVALTLTLSRASGRGFRLLVGVREGGAPNHPEEAASPRGAVFGVADSPRKAIQIGQEFSIHSE